MRRLEKLGDPPSQVDLRKRVDGMIPMVDVPELLMDVHSSTGMLDAYTRVGGLATRSDDLPVTMAGLRNIPALSQAGRADPRMDPPFVNGWNDRCQLVV